VCVFDDTYYKITITNYISLRQSQPFLALEVIVEKEHKKHKKLLARKVLIERRKQI